MKFDPVHDLQQAFRKTVEAFSFPGRLLDLDPEASKLDFSLSCPSAMLALGWMLLDTETTFACHEPELARILAMLSFARQRQPSEAQFILSDGASPAFLDDLAAAPIGDLVDPHQSATIIALAVLDASAPRYRLKGPGIDTEQISHIGLSGAWLSLRAERNQEFPIGVDLILIDRGNRMMAIPRSTRIEEVA